MCGIAGILDPKTGKAELASMAAGMANTLVHRGPNGGGAWSDDGIGLAHRRLAIIDLSPAGSQPMVSARGRHVIVYNGEIYNFRELRLELEERGYRFTGDSDTEVMLSAFDEWGITAALERFIGMFAFAVWDRQKRELWLVRDRLGIKPLYWARQGSAIAFASELKSLRTWPGWAAEVDRDALSAYMRWNYIPSPHCIYRDAWKLPPGHLLRARAGADPVIERWWDLRRNIMERARSPIDVDESEAARLLENQLLDAVGRRMVADVPLGAFLSGGIDSSTIVALMQAQRDTPVRTFTIGFDDPEYDEAHHARAVATHLGTDHTELRIDPNSTRDVIPRLPEIYDEPFADSSQIPTFLVSELTRKYVTVALSGDGGDELFAGYTRYHWADRVWRTSSRMPAAVRRAAGCFLSNVPAGVWESANQMLPLRRRMVRPAERARKLGAFLEESSIDAIYRRQHTHWNCPDEAVIGGFEPRNLAWDESVGEEIPGSIDRMQYLDTATYLPDDILTKVDRASMAVSLEVRVPMIDHRVLGLVWSLAGRDRWNRDSGKSLLRRVLYRHVPADLFSQPKKGFSVPIAQWLRGPLRNWAEDLLEEKRLRDGGFLRAEPIRKAWVSFLSGRNAAQESIWGVLMFQAWLDRWQSHH
jgi:asparagine synthase (glutamine-hydrolysing)